MKTRAPIDIQQFTARAYDLWENQWLLLTAGDFAAGQYNCMTVAWGSFGSMWARPFAQVVVRPVRHTYSFMETYDSFTLCAFDEEHRPALSYLGSRSGRNSPKIAESGLTPQAATMVAAPVYAEATLAVECRKIYWHDFDPAHFVEDWIHSKYPTHDYHRSYFGEIVAVNGTTEFYK